MAATRRSKSFQLRRSIGGRGLAVILSSSERATPTRFVPRSSANKRPGELWEVVREADAVSGSSKLVNPTAVAEKVSENVLSI